MKIGVYNRHWTTLGGGEKYGGGIAEALQDDFEVDMLAHEAFDTNELGERLALDLHRTTLRVIGDEPRSVTSASADYDLFINTSYLSSDPCAAPLGIYVVHFPSPLEPDPPPWKRLLGVVTGTRRPSSAIEWGTGFYPWTTGSLRSLIWTDGEGELLVHRPTGTRCTLELSFSRALPAGHTATEVHIEVDGAPHETVVLEPATSRLWRPIRVSVPVAERDDRPTRVVLRSDTFVPADEDGSDDTRRLGVPLTAITTRPRHPGATRRGPRTFVDTYSRIVANAEFTQGFIDRWWNVESTVVYPPVSMKDSGDKAKMILSVGRFFREEHGHSKKQLDMVRAFRKLHEQGLTDWELHLVGGCSAADRPYLEAVESESEGLPVIVHVNATGAELRSLYASAGIFWSLTGLGEDPRTHPARFEHFGITTVEAMSAAAVPIVLEAGGQVEIVRDDTDGFLIRDLDELIAATRRVATDDVLRSRLSASAEERAQYFAMPRFAERFRAVVDEVARS
ncbi:MAG: hypothetical protein QOI95_499 [Acidimicrobiaceae bacterium]